MDLSNKGKSAAAGRAVHTDHGRRRVFVDALEVVGSVGVYELERRYEQRIAVSLELLVQDGYDGASDDLDRVYDYDLAIAAIRSTVDGGHFNLIETLAERIAQTCLADGRVEEVRVRIAKPDAAPGCRAVGIEISRVRN